jgi:polyisoprenoid-binding protein YceI
MNRLAVALLIAGMGSAYAAPVIYRIDPDHTHPSFEVDHFGGLSTWRGTFKRSSGQVSLDLSAHAGSVEVEIDTGSIDLAQDKLNEHVAGPEMLNAAKFPTARFKGRFSEFDNDRPTRIDGELTLHGVTKPVSLTLNSFKCIQHPMLKKEVCGADATGSFNRSDFGVSYGAQYGFNQNVLLRIQVEAVKAG